ncbi:hypothetical protein A9G42_04485 [Gilliamella sp. Nev6-6]|nr:hypothetical protein A9G42_04485 [Gilliamella apicola]
MQTVTSSGNAAFSSWEAHSGNRAQLSRAKPQISGIVLGQRNWLTLPYFIKSRKHFMERRIP